MRILLFLIVLMLAAQAQFPLRLDPALPLGRDVLNEGFQFSPDGDDIIFLSNRNNFNQLELFRVAATGGPVTRISQNLVAGGNVRSAGLQFSPNGEQVVYLADQRLNSTEELFVTTRLGGMTRRLNPDPVFGGNVSAEGIQFSPDSTQVLYRSDHLQNEAFSLFLAQTNNNVVQQINPTLLANRDVSATGFQFSPDGARVLFHGDIRADQVFEIFSVSTNAPQTSIRLSGNLVAGGDVLLEGLQFTPDSSRVIYAANQRQLNVVELFSTPANANIPVRLSGNLVAGGNVIPQSVQVSPDGQHVFYLADQRIDNSFELFMARTDGSGSSILLSGNVGRVDLEGLQWSPDSRFVLFFGRPNGINAPAVPYLTSLADSQVQLLLNPQQGSNGDGLIQRDTIQFAGDSSRLYYLANLVLPSRQELLTAQVQPGGNALAIILNPILPPGGNVLEFQLQSSPQGERVVYLADQLTNDSFELFSTSVAGGPTVRLNSPPAQGSDVFAFRISEDSQRVLYLADAAVNDQLELFISRVETRWIGPDGDWLEDNRWINSFRPRDGATTAIHDGPTTMTVSLPVVAGELELGTPLTNAADASGLRFTGGGSLTLGNGLLLQGNSRISGDGSLLSPGNDFSFPPLTTIAVAAGESLALVSQTAANLGSIEVLGTPDARAGFSSSGVFLNTFNSGNITAQSGTLTFSNGIQNEGRLTFLSGENEILGPVTNLASGLISVAGGSQLSLVDNYQGAGVAGPGSVLVRAEVRPLSSNTDLAFGGNLALEETSRLTLIAALGTTTQSLAVTNELVLGGELVVTLAPTYSPSLGDSIDLFDAAVATGDFERVTLPNLPAGLFWDTSALATTGVLGVVANPVSYADFAQSFGLTSPFDGDEDGDGIANSLEHLFGLNPVEQDPAPSSLTLDRDAAGNRILISALLNFPGGRDTLAVIEVTSNLSDATSWTPLAVRTNGVWSNAPPVLVGPASGGVAEVSLSEVIVPGQPRFYRLRATQVTP